MRRNYSTALYRDLMMQAREMLPDAALGTDIIAGFPGETEEDFERSIEFLDSLPMTYFHVFPYSIRRGTVAAALPDQQSLEIKRIRARRVRELGAKKKKAFYRQFVGSQVSVLVERSVDGANGLYRGYSRNYVQVRFPAEPGQINHEVRVTLEGLEGGCLRGRILED
jgi:threonylcarbamoyladenosine tRNA methylthiotransferase MtaB